MMTWPAPRACKTSNGEVNDRLSLLPDDILLSILSTLTLKEAARTSLLSRRWRCIPTLIFEDPKTVLRPELLAPKQSGFISWWLEFAFGKHVKRLDLKFRSLWPDKNSQHNRYKLGINQVPTLAKLKHLKLRVIGDQSLLGFTPLIEASPVLQNFFHQPTSFKISKRDGQPLRCLKTLEILGFAGNRMDLELLHMYSRMLLISKRLLSSSTKDAIVLELQRS
ncbi:putative F-box/LRR-repeat protein At3g42770 [Chenopodium quinoa]|uniref:putative F-box/LRR-repeat protein At3g42770 n=1 Tax=Chenopodium quinoa TaxID=63459 RepID=UPI000B796999|nr:putative F-box/LRR-repeat protein At3g42770 [Chenopodium quinoa]